MSILKSTRRNENTRDYKPTFHISCEGERTEIDYFRRINQLVSTVTIKCYHDKGNSSPTGVLKTLKKNLKVNRILKKDEIWIVIDQDEWTTVDLNEVKQWEKQSTQHGVAMSIPQFEIWLLLHFADEKRQLDKHQCLKHLKTYIPNYNKGVPSTSITLDNIRQAIARDAKRSTSHYSGEIEQPLFFTVGILMSHILAAAGSSE